MNIRFGFAALIFVALCVACAPATPPYQLALSAPLTSCVAGAGADFAKSVNIIPPKSQLGGAGPGFGLTTSMTNDLATAYCMASARFQRALDNIDFFYVDESVCTGSAPSTCGNANGGQTQQASWGLRQAGGYTQIGIPAGLWTNGSAELYPMYEQDVLISLIQQPWLNWAVTPTFAPTNSSTPGNINSSWMTVLAVLAHEVGHIRWYELNASAGYGFGQNFYRLNNCIRGTFNFFGGWHYPTDASGGYLEAPNRWRGFGVSSQNLNDHRQSPTFNNANDPGSYANATAPSLQAAVLNNLYSPGQPWASFFAANAPDEDFVETYKFSVLYDTQVFDSLQMSVSNGAGTTYAQDIPHDYANGLKSILTNKVKCLKRYM
jgi:hypothetical protein